MKIVRRKTLFYDDNCRQVCRTVELVSLGSFFDRPDYNHWYVLRSQFRSRFAGDERGVLGKRLTLFVDHGRGLVLGTLLFTFVPRSGDAPLPARLEYAETMIGTFEAFKKSLLPGLKTGYCNTLNLNYLQRIGEYDVERNEYFPKKRAPQLF